MNQKITVCIEASTPLERPPLWALLQRQLFGVINETPELMLEKYVKPNGHLLWPNDPGHTSIDGLDDMYESFHNWPLFYALGGHEKFLRYSHRQYDAITEQFASVDTGYGHPVVVDEYEQGYDWMHQGEGYLFFYLLNFADPKNPKNIARSQKYASFYLNVEAGNYDPENKVMKCCFVGSKGAGKQFLRKESNPFYLSEGTVDNFGIPFYDTPGLRFFEDIKDPSKIAKLHTISCDRFRDSDTAMNLAATSLMLNAYLHTGEGKYKDWILEYIGAWREEMNNNGGIMPDNRGPSGKFGSCMDGKWYGGYYGWTWPHGFATLGDALAIAGESEAWLTRKTGAMDLLRSQIKLMEANALI